MEGGKVNSKLLLFTLILVLIVLLLLNYFFNKSKVDGVWDYKDLGGIQTVMYLGEKTYDRDTYYNLEEIVKQYLNSYVDTYSQDINSSDKLNYKEYYKYLTDSYKNYLSKAEYEKVAETFLKKFYINASSEYEVMDYMEDTNVIKNIYEYDNDTYLCELKSSQNGSVGYLAVRVNMQDNQFYIVYIE